MSFQSDQHHLDQLAKQYGAPGWSIVRWRGAQVQRACGGVTKAVGGASVTFRTPFLIGSITKLYTAALIVILIEREGLTLQQDVRSIVPELARLDRPVSIRQLLSHTSGLDGDLYLAGEQGDDVKALLRAWTRLPRIADPGEVFSYSNVGYNALGAVVTRLTGLTWGEAITTMILEPLQLAHTWPDGNFVAGEVAWGHQADGSLMSALHLGAGQAASGTTLAATAEDVMSFLRGFRTLVSDEITDLMHTPHASLPPGSSYEQWGLGWMLFSRPTVCVGHDGATSGQVSCARYEPASDEGIVFLANSAEAGAFIRNAVAALAPEFDTFVRPPPVRQAPGVANAEYVGRFAKVDSVLTVSEANGQLTAHLSRDHDPLNTVEEGSFSLAPTSADCFWAMMPDKQMVEPVAFVRDATGHVAWAHVHGRAYRRLAP